MGKDSYVDIFNLWLGLELLDAGFKQSEVVFFLRNVRPILATQFHKIIKHEYFERMSASAKDHPDLPAYPDSNGKDADPHVYLLIEKVQFEELYGSSAKGSAPSLIMRPAILNGIKALGTHFWKYSYSEHKHLIIELHHAAHSLPRLLKKAPIIKRGRK